MSNTVDGNGSIFNKIENKLGEFVSVALVNERTYHGRVVEAVNNTITLLYNPKQSNKWSQVEINCDQIASVYKNLGEHDEPPFELYPQLTEITVVDTNN